MTTNVQDLIKRVTAIAPLPHTAAADPSAGRHVIIGSNGRVLGWVATTSGDYKAVAELWTLAPTIVQALVERNAELEADSARLRGAATNSADALYRYHLIGMINGHDYGLCVEDDECKICAVIRALRAALEEARNE